MNLQTEKIQLAKMLLDTENPKILNAVRKIFKTEESADFWDELSLGQKKEIEAASAEIDSGEIVDYETFMQKHR